MHMLTRELGFAGAILGANLRSPELPYKVTFVATYHCNFRCEMCNIWQKKSVNEMTPDEVGAVLRALAAVPLGAPDRRRAVHAARSRRSGRRDPEELPVAVPAEFPDHRLVRRQDRVAGRADAGARRRPPDGRPSASTARRRCTKRCAACRAAGIKRHRDVPAAARHRSVELPDRHRHDADGEERRQGRRDDRRDSPGDSRFPPVRAAPERRPRVGALLRQRRLSGRAAPRRDPARDRGSPEEERLGRCTRCKFLEDRYQALVSKYYETGKSPLPCTALSSSCFIDAYWNLYACSIWDAKVGNLRENALRPARAVGERPPPRAARGRRRRALLALLDAVRGVSDDPRQSRARRGVAFDAISNRRRPKRCSRCASRRACAFRWRPSCSRCPSAAVPRRRNPLRPLSR